MRPGLGKGRGFFYEKEGFFAPWSLESGLAYAKEQKNQKKCDKNQKKLAYFISLIYFHRNE